MHMVDSSEKINWLRGFFIWNLVPWEESIIYDTIRNVKEFREKFNIKKTPIMKRDPKDIKYLLQDVIITYRTLESSFSSDFLEHAQPIIKEIADHFLKGLFDPVLIREFFFKVRDNKLIIGFEETLQEYYSKEGLNVRRVEDWPIEKINYVPEVLKEKLIPPIKNIFASFKSNLDRKNSLP